MSFEAGIGILVGTWATVERKTVETLAKKSCLSCPSMSINPLRMLDFEPASKRYAQEFVK